MKNDAWVSTMQAPVAPSRWKLTMVPSAADTVAVALAMTGYLNPIAAALLMPLSSFTVITSSFRARTFAPSGGGTGARAFPWR